MLMNDALNDKDEESYLRSDDQWMNHIIVWDPELHISTMQAHIGNRKAKKNTVITTHTHSKLVLLSSGTNNSLK